MGSGPAGTFAAYALRDRNVLMLDVGMKPADTSGLNENIFRLRQKEEDMFLPLIGEDFDNLHNIHARKVSLKLKPPYMSYIIKDWEELFPVSSSGFEGVTSFARGGLANAWGAGVYRFNNEDLRDFPIKMSELEPYYDRLTEHIGISGQDDDLTPYFGNAQGLLEPPRISRFAAEFLDRYQKKRSYLNERGIFVGLPRLALLTRKHNEREAYKYEYLEFFKPCIPAVYTPAFTLDEIIKEQSIQYKDNYLVLRYRECETCIEVVAKNLKTGELEKFQTKKLILAAGALNTAKIVLRSNDDCVTKLAFLDNPMAVMLLFRLARIGSGLEIEGSTLAQLNIVYHDSNYGSIQASLYGTNGPLRSDTLFDLPLPASASLKIMKYLAQAAGAVMIFYPGRWREKNFLKLTSANTVEVRCENEQLGSVERVFMHAFRKIGYYTAPFLFQYPKMGQGLHYAGMLPMKVSPGRYETDKDGRLFGTRNVFIADGACFPSLPSKNLTFTIMANSMRIAESIKCEMSA